jgi:Tfp pilus assembly ATPase PilU
MLSPDSDAIALASGLSRLTKVARMGLRHGGSFLLLRLRDTPQMTVKATVAGQTTVRLAAEQTLDGIDSTKMRFAKCLLFEARGAGKASFCHRNISQVRSTAEKQRRSQGDCCQALQVISHGLPQASTLTTRRKINNKSVTREKEVAQRRRPTSRHSSVLRRPPGAPSR